MLEDTSRFAGIKHAREETEDENEKGPSDDIPLNIKQPKLESTALDEEDDESAADESQDEGDSSSSGSDPSLSASTRDSDEESEELDEEPEEMDESSRSLEDTETNLRARLQSFLPRIAEANEELLARGEGEAGNGFEIAHTAVSEDDQNEGGEDVLDEVEDGEEQGPYIEMNLGLGILEEIGARGRDADEEAVISIDPQLSSVSDEVADGSDLPSRGDGLERNDILGSLSSVGVAKHLSRGSDDEGENDRPAKITEL